MRQIGDDPVGEALRILAVFSLPTEQTALGLRRERYALTRLVRRLAGQRAVELEVLQYGVTRERPADAVTTGAGGDGWDVLPCPATGPSGSYGSNTPTVSPTRWAPANWWTCCFRLGTG